MVSKPYRKRYGNYYRRGSIKNRVNVDERPAVVAQRGRIGDWEGDTIIGKGRQRALLTMVERKTLYTVIIRLTGKHTDLLAQAAIKGMKALTDRIKTITFGNGLEFSEHEKNGSSPGCGYLFCASLCILGTRDQRKYKRAHPQYFPKGTDFNQVSDKAIQHVMDRLNIAQGKHEIADPPMSY